MTDRIQLLEALRREAMLGGGEKRLADQQRQINSPRKT